ncbi:MAG: NAD(P)-dependent oxidoreductase [Labilithrix sp.]|nr:NAD(P)-dependent oxidoreductase [Labilithrix sp.]MCW5813189.1 NAD(P)-dependent oxidoreductase [Labilithrix sp.]
MGTVLVTGSAGHLGEALVRSLRAAGREVRGLDRLASAFTDVVGSIDDEALVASAMDGVDAVLHAATLHKPHVATRSARDFIAVNVSGTQTLLEAAVRAGVRAFVYTSTTSTFGDALVPAAGEPAAWITEETRLVPKNIYGVTKAAAEDLCALAHRNQKLACLVLRTSRFFPEDDDDAAAAAAYAGENLKTNELLHRRADVEDIVDAHLRALERAPRIGFARYIVSATTPFRREDCALLRRDAPAALDARVPEWRAVYAARKWTMNPTLDRIYDNAKARAELGWEPRWDFTRALRETFPSDLARAIGSKGYDR